QSVPDVLLRRRHHPRRAQPGSQGPTSPSQREKADRVPHHPTRDTSSARRLHRPHRETVHHGKPTRLSTDTVAAVLTSAATTAGRTCPSVPENIHCHMLRKTKAMDLYQQGIPLPIIMRLLGHENVSTTAAFYAFATLDMMREAVNAATPAINSPSERLTQDKLQALYSLR
ncbi:MAG: tyrosine-type recombinase/integrase, partial [Pseudonocardiaceae bacterium]